MNVMKKKLLLLLILSSLLFAGCLAENQKKALPEYVIEADEESEEAAVDVDQVEKKGDKTSNVDIVEDLDVKEIETSEPSEIIEKPAETAASEGVAYTEFEKTAYEKAKAERKIIFLEFFANWCPSCKEQEPILESAFAKIANPNIVAFKVHFNDSETTEEEKEVAKEFGIVFQTTHLILDSKGNIFKKVTGVWPEETIIQELEKAAGV